MTRSLKCISFLATSLIVVLLVWNIGREPARQSQAFSRYQSTAVAQGINLYAAHCARCHGAAGEGLGVYRALNQEFIASKPAGELFTTIHYGRYATDMAAFGLEEGGALTPPQIDTLVLMLQQASWDTVETRVAELGMLPTEADIQAAVQAAEPAAASAAPADPAVLDRALVLFNTHCTECHGEQGQGTADAPQLNNAYVQGMTTVHLNEILMLGVRNTDMESFAGRLSPQEIAALIALLQHWDQVDGQASAAIATEAEIAAVTETGDALFGMWCAVCHGTRGEGGAIAPSLNDIPRLPDDFIASRVRSGKNAMPPFPEDSLSNGQLAVIIAYAQGSVIGSGLPAFSAEELALGQARYEQECAECHGLAGEGVAEKGPRINTLPPMRAGQIITFTRVGSAQTPAIPSSVVSDADLRLIVAYLHSLAQ